VLSRCYVDLLTRIREARVLDAFLLLILETYLSHTHMEAKFIPPFCFILQGIFEKMLRHPGIEPGASAWEADILPLNQRRAYSVVKLFYYNLNDQ
jgi:hypothetical protein